MGLHCGIGFASVASSKVLQKEEAHLDSLFDVALWFKCCSPWKGQFCLRTFHTSGDQWATCTVCSLTTVE